MSAVFRSACRLAGLLAVLAAVLGGSSRAGERRVALVVGAAAYRAVPSLRNTLNDARGMTAALSRLGFEVDTVLDPDRLKLEAAIRRFGTRARGADVALFFYAGHAVEAAGRNWLLPVSADVRGGRDLRFEAIELDAVMEQLDGAARMTVVMLDACRDNPFRMVLGEGGRGLPAGGLAQVQAAAGTLVVFSTAPGTVAADGTGSDSPFTTALLKRIEAPGQEIHEVLAAVRRDVREATHGQQIPWEQSAMEGMLYLKPSPIPSPAAPGGPSALPTPAPGLSSGPELEALFWDSVRNSKNPNEVRAYLRRFPDGVFAELARTRIASLQAPPLAPAPPTDMPVLARIANNLPGVAPKLREEAAKSYVDRNPSKALAVSLEKGEPWATWDWSSGPIAEEHALEGCQAYSGNPCIVFAVNDDVLSPEPSGTWPSRDMPRIHYAGVYDPVQIPALPPSTRASATVRGYGAAPAPKAMAFHPWGRVFTATAAASLVAAEEDALAACRADPTRKGQNGPCFLYAIGDRVILPQRLTKPDAGLSAAVPPVAAAPNPLVERMIAALPLPSAARWTADITRYSEDHIHKALAVAPEQTGIWWSSDWGSPETAETMALERCQLFYGVPCRLFASDDQIRPVPLAPHEMARVAYGGVFDASNIPAINDAARKSAAVAGYAGVAGPKAIALHPLGNLFTITGADSQHAAEEMALARCNAETKGRFGPCFLYAAGNQVVLPQRRIRAAQ